MSNIDLEETISAAVEDATPDLQTDDAPLDTPEPAPEATPDPVETPRGTQLEATPDTEPKAVATPVGAPIAKEPDEFEKKYGIPALSNLGKENRIPYSRVTKIVGKAVKEAEDKYTPMVTALEGKTKEYETRLEKVGQFEQVMLKEPQKFVEMLQRLPQYQQLFASMQAKPAADPTMVVPPPVDPNAEMPGPDFEQPDGSKVYTLEGLKKRDEWRDRQVETRVLKQIEERYKPLETGYQEQQRAAAAQHHLETVVIPTVQREMAEARKWARFTENEDAIVKVLQENPAISLEGAYRQVVMPQFTTDREKMRAEILAEIKKVPTATSAPISSTRPGTPTQGKQSLEDIIKQAIAPLQQR